MKPALLTLCSLDFVQEQIIVSVLQQCDQVAHDSCVFRQCRRIMHSAAGVQFSECQLLS